MQGSVLEFNLQKNKGVIVTTSGNKYNFNAKEWKSKDSLPQKNTQVEFMLEGESAIFIYPLKGQTKVQEKKNTKSTMYALVSLLSSIIGLLGFLYYAYNAKDINYGFLYTIPSLFAIITGHLSSKNKTRLLGLVLGYVVSMTYIIVIILGSVLS